MVDALQRGLDEGSLVLREPTEAERKQYRLSHNVREVVDLS